MRPLLLDLFCCQGGASMGYNRAGFDVIGVDLKPQPRYPFQFIQADALEFLATPGATGPFAAIHASPPCQAYTSSGEMWRLRGREYPDLIAATRDLLTATGLPWVMENVPGAPLRPDLKLCGCMFGLWRLKRERWFETSWHALELRQPCHHPELSISVAGNVGRKTGMGLDWDIKTDDWRRAMGIDWMTGRGMAQAIPPAYTEHIGGLLMAELGRAAA
jgi:DNA (cytosine-5)-methyltransferase 1